MSNNLNHIMLGVPIGSGDLRDITELAISSIEHRSKALVFVCANPHSLVLAQKDPIFKQALCNADIVVADGVGVTMMASLVNRDVGPRIAGEEFYKSLLNELNIAGKGRIFFFGSSSNVLEKIKQRFHKDYPSLTTCGVLSPPYREWTEYENTEMIKTINHSQPDVLWVGMTAPKQEKWVQENRARLNVPVIGSIGAVFDFYAGTYPRAPGWMCQIGLEWLYRLINEPRRMWRRNFISNPKFVLLVVWKHLLKRV